ncbi:PINIT domain-containing protein [Vararia minispora EC-137]|uniref:PINIT domain-containing protein n=1 Tax=Vararia minispora EC-137 TaxID=1314806 RepID=A0ACB8QLU0_9AGAM|nr:PINIT domain-containing protein [Vararia minispora EC-137]
MSGSDPYRDFEELKRIIRSNTVDRLKTIITGFTSECGVGIGKNGRKQELVDRLVDAMTHWKFSGSLEKFEMARGIVYQVRATGSGSARPTAPRYPHTPAFPTSSASGLPPRPPAASTSSISMFTVLPRTLVSQQLFSLPPKVVPFLLKRAGGVANRGVFRCAFIHAMYALRWSTLPIESQGPQDRRQQSLNFTLNADHADKLQLPNQQYQLRLYCTSSSFFSFGTNSYRFNGQPCPVEFPPTCEIRVNNVQVSASTKGLKKKPGTAPPPDLGTYAQMKAGVPNRVDLVYVNSQQSSNQQPAPPKKYYLVVMLVQFTSTEQLIDRLRKGKYVSAESIRAERCKKAAEEDDDIISGPSKISLKCPLSYVRISIPCRSSQCVHPSCFDALSWYSLNEQTTTWSCPICEKIILHEELIIDGVFDEILKATSEDTEDVMVEADGEWHTSDGEYASALWKATHPPVLPPIAPPAPTSAPSTDSPASSTTVVNDATVSKTDISSEVPEVEVFVLDSDDDDEGQVKRQLSPSGQPSSSLGSLGGSYPPDSQQVIDLTLDSDEEATPPPPTATGKRAAPDDDYGAGLKRARIEEPFSERMNDPAYRLPPPTSQLPSPMSPFSAFVGSGPLRYGSGSSLSSSSPQPGSGPLPPPAGLFTPSSYHPRYPGHKDWP